MAFRFWHGSRLLHDNCV